MVTISSVARTSAASIAVAGLIILGGYAAGVVMPGMFPPPWSCVGFAAAGSALLLGRRPSRTTARSLLMYSAAILVLLIGVITWSEFLSGKSFGFDALLFPNSLLKTAVHPGRPAPTTGFSFALLGL